MLSFRHIPFNNTEIKLSDDLLSYLPMTNWRSMKWVYPNRNKIKRHTANSTRGDGVAVQVRTPERMHAGAPDLRPYETRLRDICMISSPEVRGRTLPGHGSTTSAAGGVAGAADKRTVTVTRRPRLLATRRSDGTRAGTASLWGLGSLRPCIRLDFFMLRNLIER